MSNDTAINVSSWAQYTLKVNFRKSFQDKLDAANIPSSIHYPMPLNKQPAVLTQMQIYQLVIIYKKVVSIPMHAI